VLGSSTPAAHAPAVTSKPAVAVLPFNNMSGDPEQEFFADGMTEDIITALSRTRWFDVTARNSTFAYKGQSPDIREVAQTLGVGYVLEGSIRKGGNQVRINVQLIDAGTGNHIWADRYDRGLDDEFAVQDEIAQRISSVLTERVWQDIARNIGAKRPAEYGAWDHAIRGVELLHRLEPETVAEAEGHLLKALALDPDHHIAHVALGFCYLAGSFWGDPDRGSQIEKAFAHARKLQEIAPDDAQTYRLLTRIYSAKGMFDEAWDCAERALRINPHDGDIIGNRGVYHLFDGDFGQAVEWLDKVLELHADTPHTMDIMRYWKALALFGARDYDACAALLTSITGLNFLKAELLAPCYARLGDTARAKAKTAELLQMHPDVHLSHVGLWKAFRHEADRQHLLEAMREAGFPE
jgi:adenylate cyclase